ncbi:MAG: GNAT family N-acetyltransferase [Cellvibrionaceae bacterium]|nr:GNAT family N-acetyltransferase [Cellvibrionaceae bacterium]
MTIELIVTNYQDHQEELSRVRKAVFVAEQNVPEEIEYDDRDAICQHVLIRVDGQAAATGRIDIEKQGKVGRVAVLPSLRQHNLGRQVMDALEQLARDAKLPKIWFHAQLSAVGFYQRLGYDVVGDDFLEAGIVHRKMEKKIATI